MEYATVLYDESSVLTVPGIGVWEGSLSHTHTLSLSLSLFFIFSLYN